MVHRRLSELSNTIQRALRCPICGSGIETRNEHFHCTNAKCGGLFPIVDGIPILINESSSIFSIDDFVRRRSTTFKPLEGKVVEMFRRRLPSISKNITSKQNYAELAKLLLKSSSNPVVLVIGGSMVGKGMESLVDHSAIELVESDVAFGPHTRLICDAHDIPFAQESFDGVIVQAVLEHVVDPYRCVDEIYRVLKEDGLVYAETPFMQQVHGGPYDFTRFTHLGHRRLFRKFEEIASGACCGPGMALAWACQYFLLSFAETKLVRRFIRGITSLLFPLKYFDHYLVDKPGTLDAASGYFFLGRKSELILSDRKLVELYRGAL